MKKKIVYIGIIAIVALIYFSGCTGTTQDKNNSNKDSNSNLEQNETEIRIPISDISTTAKFYSSDFNGITIRYFAVKDQQEKIHIAFDACDVCYEAKKGYKQNGDDMQCLNCGQKFLITSIGTENIAGGCWPSYLSYNIDENDLVITITDLIAKQYLF